MQKNKLLRDGQIVGYEVINGDSVSRSYDNQVWTEYLVIPNDDKKSFVNFDSVTLTEVYEE